MEEQITLKLSKEDKEKIEKAANSIGLGHTTFTRVAALEKANLILKGL